MRDQFAPIPVPTNAAATTATSRGTQYTVKFAKRTRDALEELGRPQSQPRVQVRLGASDVVVQVVAEELDPGDRVGCDLRCNVAREQDWERRQCQLETPFNRGKPSLARAPKVTYPARSVMSSPLRCLISSGGSRLL